MHGYTIKAMIFRYLLLCVGLAIMALGVAFSIRASLGTSPISSVPYVISLISPLSVGTATILMHCVFILIQIFILRRRYELIQLMQLPVALIFGFMCDFALWMLQGVSYGSYLQQWLLCLIGIVLVAIGVFLEVSADVVVLAGEGVSLAICKVLPIRFSSMKVIFDVTLVLIACVLGFGFTGSLQGVREGTIAAAVPGRHAGPRHQQVERRSSAQIQKKRWPARLNYDILFAMAEKERVPMRNA